MLHIASHRHKAIDWNHKTAGVLLRGTTKSQTNLMCHDM